MTVSSTPSGKGRQGERGWGRECLNLSHTCLHNSGRFSAISTGREVAPAGRPG